MGYTHYWTCPYHHRDYARTWNTLITDTRTILTAVSAHGIRVAGPAGQGEPLIDPSAGIVLNGLASQDENSETFRLQPPLPAPDPHDPGGFAFCKTSKQPYDLAVTTILLRLRLLLPTIVTLSSDGTWDSEWAQNPTPTDHPAAPRPAARTLYGGLFGECPTPSPLTS